MTSVVSARGLGLTLILAAFATPAAAAVLPIEGAYGNAGGCNYFMTGSIVDDGLIVLTADTVATYATGCDFGALLSAKDGVYRVEAICSSEGETSKGQQTLVISDRGKAGYFVKLGDLEEWGPFLPCPGTAHIDILPERAHI